MEFEQLITLIKTVSDSELTGFRYEENGVSIRLNKEKKKPAVKTFSQPAPSKFRNFEEHSYDMDALTKELLQTN